jgi:hypothetical protein
MTRDDEEAFEKAVSHLSDTTKTYMHAYKDLIERYVTRINAVNYDIPLFYQLQKLFAKEAEALYAEYVAERAKQGLPSEVGRMVAR